MRRAREPWPFGLYGQAVPVVCSRFALEILARHSGFVYSSHEHLYDFPTGQRKVVDDRASWLWFQLVCAACRDGSRAEFQVSAASVAKMYLA